MKKIPFSSWRVKKNGEAISILGKDSSIVAVLPRNNGRVNSPISEAYVIAAAPQLLDACNRLKSILENNLVVTAEGFKINCSEIREDLLSVILRAKGCRKSPDEPGSGFSEAGRRRPPDPSQKPGSNFASHARSGRRMRASALVQRAQAAPSVGLFGGYPFLAALPGSGLHAPATRWLGEALAVDFVLDALIEKKYPKA